MFCAGFVHEGFNKWEHILRADHTRLIHQALQHIGHHRQQGDVLMDSPDIDTRQKLKGIAANREQWKAIVYSQQLQQIHLSDIWAAAAQLPDSADSISAPHTPNSSIECAAAALRPDSHQCKRLCPDNDISYLISPTVHYYFLKLPFILFVKLKEETYNMLSELGNYSSRLS